MEGQIINHAPVWFKIQNYGQAPARSVKLVANAVIGGYWSAREQPVGLMDKPVVPLGDIAPGQEKLRPGYAVAGLSEGLRDISNGASSIFLEGQIQYEDDFGNSYYTNFQLAMTGIKLMNEPPSVTPHWNQAT